MAILVLEASTSAAKAMVYEPQKGVVNMITRMYPESVSDGSAIEADGMMAMIFEIGNEAAAGYDIEVVALNCTWHSVLITDSSIRPKTRILTWAWRDASAIAMPIRANEELTRTLYYETGCMPHAIYPLYKLMLLQKQDMIKPDDKVLDQGSFLYHRLTGELRASTSLISGTALMNTHNLDWNQHTIEMAGISVNQLPELQRYSKENTYATLLPEAARLLGVKPGIPVGLPYPDGSMNQVGAGALKPGIMTLSVGTSGALRVTSDKPILPQSPGTWCYYAPDRYICGAATNGATNCVDWFKITFSPEMSYKEMDNMVLRADMSTPPTFLPFLYGERCPGWMDSRRGGFAGILAAHRLPELYAALLEGILFNLYQCYELLTTATDAPYEIRISGGINNSRIWSQMAADLWNQPLRIAKSSQASLLGGAAMGMAALGLINSPEDFEGDRGLPSEPNPENSALIRARYQQYLEFYQQGNC